MLDLCSTGMIMASLIMGLLGGAASLAFMLQITNSTASTTDPISIEDGLAIGSGFVLFSTFLPMSIALGVGKAILMKMEEDQTSLD